MRITTGELKGRSIDVLKGDATRPTSDKMRQAIFNVLTHCGYVDFSSDLDALDLFAGSGAMGLEALSRQLCTHVTFVESHAGAYDILKKNCLSMLENDEYKTIKADALKAPLESYDLVFLDPPYHKGLIEKSIQRLLDEQALKEGAVIVIEAEKDLHWQTSDFKVFQHKEYGMSQIFFCLYKGKKS